MDTVKLALTRRQALLLLAAQVGGSLWPALANDSLDIPPQPYFAGVKRALDALSKLGSPVTTGDMQRLSFLATQNDAAAVNAAEQILSRYTLANVVLEPTGAAQVTAGNAPRTLIEQGWRVFLTRVSNRGGATDKLCVGSGLMPIAAASSGASRAGLPDALTMAPYIARAWLRGELFEAPPMQATLSGFVVEYRIVQLYSRDHGQLEGELYFFMPKDGYSEYRAYLKRTRLKFDCLPSRDVFLHVRDADGRPCMASLTIKDKLGRVYPLQAMRLAPDMQFQPQIYRADGETVRLPDGEYTVESQRGPEYLSLAQEFAVDAGKARLAIKLERWIDPAGWGWYSGDTHIHAGGCAHYEHPTEGVTPETMIRHVRGEALSIGDVLSWGPSWYYQKTFFSGAAVSPQATLEHPELQVANNASLQARPTAEDSESLLRYDVEVSGFPSSHCGHLVLLCLKEQDYPGTKLIQDWPSWNLPIYKWARSQGALAGVAHCGNGMVVDSDELPNYEIPPMDNNGTQEAIIDVTHGYVDFLSGCDTHPLGELNAWYHMLNCGFRPSMIGETDWPCASDDRVGGGRTYVRLDHRPIDDSGYEAWIRGLKEGRLYFGDGRSHFLEFTVKGRRAGDGDLALQSPGEIHVEALVAARLAPEITPETAPKRVLPGWGWHLEWGRIGDTRQILVELIVNGVAVEKTP